MFNKQQNKRTPKKQQKTVVDRLVKFCKSMLLVSCLMGVAVALFYTYQGVNRYVSTPVDRVVVNGDFQHVVKQSIVDEVLPYLEKGFMALDIDGMRSQLLRRPWIYEVSVSRVWPGELVITVVEERAIARWGEVGFLNHRGDFFQHQEKGKDDFLSLPLLTGPENSAGLVMSHYRDLSSLLNQEGFSLEQLQLDDRGNWHVVINDNITMVLGKSEVMEKMQRFLVVCDAVLKNDLDRISKIDMRYSNGFAVQWVDDGVEA